VAAFAVSEVHVEKCLLQPDDVTGVLSLLPPFPVVIVSTQDNAITVNQIAYFSFRPLRVGVGIAHTRHSYALLSGEREFVINIPDASLLEAVEACGSLSGRDGDKYGPAGLTAVSSAEVDAVSIEECAAHIECRVEQELSFEERTWFIARVVAASSTPSHEGMASLTCGRRHYVLPGAIIADR
jgi:flavin reductase (DIM6/NTAB) family NADH-FMN oxidoreductase RutF